MAARKNVEYRANIDYMVREKLAYGKPTHDIFYTDLLVDVVGTGMFIQDVVLKVGTKLWIGSKSITVIDDKSLGDNKHILSVRVFNDDTLVLDDADIMPGTFCLVSVPVQIAGKIKTHIK